MDTHMGNFYGLGHPHFRMGHQDHPLIDFGFGPSSFGNGGSSNIQQPYWDSSAASTSFDGYYSNLLNHPLTPPPIHLSQFPASLTTPTISCAASSYHHQGKEEGGLSTTEFNRFQSPEILSQQFSSSLFPHLYETQQQQSGDNWTGFGFTSVNSHRCPTCGQMISNNNFIARGRNNRRKKHCFICNRKSHLARNCPINRFFWNRNA